MTYHIEYRRYNHDQVNKINVIAKNKVDAYWKAVDLITEKEGTPYSVWISGVTYKNGRCRLFNQFEGNPY